MTTEPIDYPGLRNSLMARALKLGMRHPDAQDVVQDTLVAALTKGACLRGEDLQRWCSVVLKNAVVSRYRSAHARASRQGVSLQDDDVTIELPVRATQEDAVLLGEALQQLQHLPPRAQRLLRMVTIDGETFEAAANAESLKMGTLKSALSRAQAEWRARLMARPQSRSLAA